MLSSFRKRSCLNAFIVHGNNIRSKIITNTQSHSMQHVCMCSRMLNISLPRTNSLVCDIVSYFSIVLSHTHYELHFIHTPKLGLKFESSFKGCIFMLQWWVCATGVLIMKLCPVSKASTQNKKSHWTIRRFYSKQNKTCNYYCEWCIKSITMRSGRNSHTKRDSKNES